MTPSNVVAERVRAAAARGVAHRRPARRGCRAGGSRAAWSASSRDRDVGAEAVVLGHRVQRLREPAVAGRHAPPRRMAPSSSDRSRFGQHQVGVDLEPRAEAGAVRAGAVRRVEAEVARRQLLEAAAVIGAGVALAVEAVLLLRPSSGRLTQERRPKAQRGLDRVAPSARVGACVPSASVRRTTSRSTTTSMLCLYFLSSAISSSRSRSSPSTRTRTKPPCFAPVEELLVLALAVADEGRQEHEPRPVRQVVQLVDDLLHRLAADLAAADGQCVRPMRANRRRR